MIKNVFRVVSRIGMPKYKAPLILGCTMPQFRFCTAPKTIDSLSTQLEGVYKGFQSENDSNKRVELMREAIALKKEIHSLRKEDKAHYDGYSRDQLVIAQLHMQNDQKPECQKIINEILQGGYMNEYQNNTLENEGFLAELFIIQCVSNLENLGVAEEAGLKALEHCQYFIDNHCPIFQSVANKTEMSEVFDLDVELQSLQNMTQQLQLVAKIQFEKGQLDSGLQNLSQKATYLDILQHTFKRLIDKEIKVKTEMTDDEMRRYLMGCMINQAITLKQMARYCTKLKRYQDSKSLIEGAIAYFDYFIEVKVVDEFDDSYVDILAEQYKLIKETTNDKGQLDKIASKLENIIKNLKESEDTKFTKFEYELFRVKYLGANITELDLQINKLGKDVTSLLQYNEAKLEYFIENQQLDEAQTVSQVLIDLVNQYFDSQHQFYGLSVKSAIEIALSRQKYDVAQQYLEQFNKNLKEMEYLIDRDTIAKVFQLSLEFQTKVANKQQDQALKVLEQIESVPCKTFDFAYEKSMILSKQFGQLNMKQQQKNKLQECLNILGVGKVDYKYIKTQQKVQQAFNAL